MMFKKAFTLIELLIVTTIILLFSGLVLAQYNNFTQQQNLRTEAQKLANMLELARKKTLSKEIITSCSGAFNGYKLTINSNNYMLSYCTTSNCNCTTTDIPFTYNIPSGTPVTFLPSPVTSIQFLPSFQGTDLTGTLSIQIKNTSINQCVQLSVSKIGIVTYDSTLTSC